MDVLADPLDADELLFKVKRITGQSSAASSDSGKLLQTIFNSTYDGFRFTVLNPDSDIFEEMVETLKDALQKYIAS